MRFVADRRRLLGAGSALVGLMLVPASFAHAADDAVAAAIREAIGDRKIEEGGITLRLPALAENGAQVPLTVALAGVPNAVTVHLFATRNPTPGIASFRLSPAIARTELTTRIRVAEEQTIVALAELSDGRVLRSTATVKVTVGGCIG